MADLSHLTLDSNSSVPLYRQLADSVTRLITDGAIQSGDKLPPTRELASQLGLNRTTVAAAYSTLEEAGLIRGHVGRGSFVSGAPKTPVLLPPASAIEISFSSSRPATQAFPLDAFRRITREVIDAPDAAEILQFGPAHGFPPLRRYLLESAFEAGLALPSDDLIITSGCQQALDLFARISISNRTPIAVEDPVYHGLIRIFQRAGAEFLPIPMDADGLDVNALQAAFERHRPKMLIVTPSFQNPTGATLSLSKRQRIIELAARYGVMLVENGIYSELRYRGTALPTLKELDESGNTILLRSFSKVLFPGLRVGWIIGPRAIITQLAEAKQISDLHSDQLSQAVLLRFTQSGELQRHLERTLTAGRERLETVLAACQQFLPHGATFTRPDGGMNLWIELPAPLAADRLLARAQERGVDFLPGRYFSARGDHARGLRISFGGLPPDQIRRGLQILGECASNVASATYEPNAVLV